MDGTAFINSAARLVGIIGSGQSLNAEELADGLVTFNQLIANWNLQQVPLFSIGKTEVTMTGAASYTLVSRLARIISAAVVTAAGLSAPADVVDAGEWASVLDKTRTGLVAEKLYYDAAATSAKVYLSPKPGAGTLELYALSQLSEVATLGTTLTFPAGYDRALRAALAIDLAGEYDRQVPESVAAVAAEAMGAIVTINGQVVGPAVPPPPPPQQAA